VFRARQERFERNLKKLDSTSVRTAGGDSVRASQTLKTPEVRLEDLVRTGQVLLEIDPERPANDLSSVETTVKYAGYLKRQDAEIERSRKDERRRIPHGFPFSSVPGLSKEVIQRLEQVQPDTLAHALRVPGVTPAAIAVLSSYVGRLAATPGRGDGF
jgi:tRNA uridine 5-carboxymethylaminomethyl modification enzyme